MDDIERNLVHAAQRGDGEAFERLVVPCERQVLRVIMSVLGDGPDAYDAYQETLVRAFSRLSRFRLDSTFATWITRIGINQALNARRSRHPDRHRSLDEVGAAGSRSSASEQAEQTDIGRAVDLALDELSERERAVFVLRHRHGYRLREIGDMLGCAEGTIKNYMFRAVRKLRVSLEPHYADLRS